jgi:hypothetical protein
MKKVEWGWVEDLQLAQRQVLQSKVSTCCSFQASKNIQLNPLHSNLCIRKLRVQLFNNSQPSPSLRMKMYLLLIYNFLLQKR